MSGACAKTLYRIKSYQFAIDTKEYNWGDSVSVLDNDGKPTTVTCSMAMSSQLDNGVARSGIAFLSLFVISVLNAI
ncbi:hypothetical protein GGI08_000392 [Coemansia sp. S2]|nr:hypothetical protein GGI08_000392 [Coemansia sp. S2]KAJ2099224.1 hypothetical protein GGI09_002896 [Coemansia sp. S100]KAJ2107917.1 hypothetical protein GGI16_001338 [Coemansia sp. S142-1]